MLTYAQCLNTLFNINVQGGQKLGLDNISTMCHLLEHPEKKFASIHVAGTNGKGSVTTKIAKGLQAAGFRVGLYTSPHIATFRERIAINGCLIEEEQLAVLFNKLLKVANEHKINATFFEYATLLCFLYFASQNVDYAVLETGLGGRLDATNVISPILSVITSIAYDHTDILGKTIEEIAREKGGIIKENIPVILGPRAVCDELKSIACHKKSQALHTSGVYLDYEEENKAIARSALHHLSSRITIPSEAIENGLLALPPCRFEKVCDEPVILLDVAHNPDGVEALLKKLTHHYPGKTVRFLFGLSQNKDIRGCLRLFAQRGSHFHIVEAENGRAASASSLYEQLHALNHGNGDLLCHKKIEEGVLLAKNRAEQGREVLVICGSFFIMRQAREALGLRDSSDPLDLNERWIREKII